MLRDCGPSSLDTLPDAPHEVHQAEAPCATHGGSRSWLSRLLRTATFLSVSFKKRALVQGLEHVCVGFLQL